LGKRILPEGLKVLELKECATQETLIALG